MAYLKTYFVIGTRRLSKRLDAAFIAAVQFDPDRPLEPQLKEYAEAHGVVLSMGLVACEAAATIGGPYGKGPV